MVPLPGYRLTDDSGVQQDSGVTDRSEAIKASLQIYSQLSPVIEAVSDGIFLPKTAVNLRLF